MPKNIIEKIWDSHVVEQKEGHPAVFAIDLQLVHEVTSPQAFEVLRQNDLPVKFPHKHLATLDHSIPTRVDRENIFDPIAKKQVEALRSNVKQFGVPMYDFGSGHQGIAHVVGPETGATQPGMTIVCGDSHTATHGAFGALAFGVGTTEVGLVMATGCILQNKPKTMKVEFAGRIPKGVYSKDLVLKLISEIGLGGANGYIIEYTGDAIEQMSMEARMSVCNMSIECGARGGLVAPDQKTFDYIRGSVENERIIFLHSRGASSDIHFYKPVGERLENLGYEVVYVDIDTSLEESEAWRQALNKNRQFFTPNTTVVSHSISSLAFCRFMSDNQDVKLKAWHSVGGVFGNTQGSKSTPDSQVVKGKLLGEGLHYNKMNENIGKIFLHHSTDDDRVPFESVYKYMEVLPKAELIKYEGRRHFLANRKDSNFQIPFDELGEMIIADSVIVPRPFSPKEGEFDRAVEYWKSLVSDEGCSYDKEIIIDASQVEPMISWGVAPSETVGVSQKIPFVADYPEAVQAGIKKALEYTKLEEGQAIEGLPIDWAFLGSCTNARIEDLRIAARLLDGKKVADGVTFYIVPGSEEVKARAEEEGLDKIFVTAGASWRMPGCSMCLGMNDDKVPSGQRCVSTSNRNFMHRQGPGAITHLASPATVALSAVAGEIVDVRKEV